MLTFSTNQVAQRLGIATKTLSRYIAQGKVPAPRILEVGGSTIHIWTEGEIDELRKLLPKIANGRKTRYQKLREKQGTQAGASPPHPGKPGPSGGPGPALHKTKKPKKRKPKAKS